MRSSGTGISIKVHNITISYNEVGPADGIAIIFIHGFPFDKSTWDNQIQFLSSSYRCIAYDLRGFGNSTNDENNLSINGFADDLNGFMEILQIDKAIICGLSMGGYITLKAFNKYPSRFSGMILCDTQCYADSPETKEKRKKAVAQIQLKGKEKFAVDFIKNAFSDETLEKKAELIKYTTKIIVNSSDSIIIKAIKALAEREDLCNTLNNIDIPTLIICGELDKITPLKLSDHLHKNIKNSELKIIKGAGHLSNLEEQVSFNIAIKEFLERKFSIKSF